MKTETTISRSIRIAEDKAKYDAACKQLLSEKIILAWILKSCVEEFHDIEAEEIADQYIEGSPQISEIPVAPDEKPPQITGMSTEDCRLNEGTVTFDIRFYATAPKSDELIRLILNVEAQHDFYPGYPLIKRGIYYCSRMISAQYSTEFTESHYEKIRKVYSIWICVNPPAWRQNTITCYRITEYPLIGNATEPEENYDLMQTIMICLGNPQDQNHNGVLKLLDVLLSDKTSQGEKKQVLQDDFNIPMSHMLEKEVSSMCNLSEGVWSNGMQQGMQQKLIENIQNLMETMKWTAQQAMAALKVPEDEQPKYEELLK